MFKISHKVLLGDFDGFNEAIARKLKKLLN